jgi:SHS2 domain-containing protein
MKKYTFLPHTADIKFQANGKTIEKAFENSALALKQVITNNQKIKQNKTRKIKIQAKDYENLLYDFLEEFLFLLDSKGFLLSKIQELKIIKKKSRKNELILTSKIIGDNAKNYKISNQVKAITFNQMKITIPTNKKQDYQTQVVLDV